jgi:electron transfer flavoprotein alpha subunit
MILTLVEKNLDGSAVEVSLEALTFARNLSAVGGGVPIDAVVVASDGQGLTDELHKEVAAYGVRHVYVLGGGSLSAYSGAGGATS